MACFTIAHLTMGPDNSRLPYPSLRCSWAQNTMLLTCPHCLQTFMTVLSVGMAAGQSDVAQHFNEKYGSRSFVQAHGG
jgi:hypothetical protein